MITQEQLNWLFEYKDGELYWKNSNRRGYNGKKAGNLHPNGNQQVKINGAMFLKHRIIFLMHHGYLPEFIDHKDCNRLNNKIENLRPATRAQNNRNSKARNNSSGIKGVHWHKASKKWQVQLGVNGVNMSFGIFDDLELAELVAIEARNKYHKEFAKHD